MLARSARWPIAETNGLSGIAIRVSGTERLGNSGHSGNSGSTWAGVSGAIVLSPGATGSGNSGTVLVGGDAGSLGAGGSLSHRGLQRHGSWRSDAVAGAGTLGAGLVPLPW